MGKNRQKKRPLPSSSFETAWKPVPVFLSGDDSKVSGETDSKDAEETLANNHYDNIKLSRQAEKDLPMNPGEDCAMFYGLEVLDSSHYEVVGSGSSKRLIIMERSSEERKVTKQEQELAEPDTGAIDSESRKKRKKEKKVSKSKTEDRTVDTEVCQPKSTKMMHTKGQLSSNGDVGSSAGEEKETSFSPEQLAAIQSSWREASGGAHLHDSLVESLCRLGFETPTPIQAATLSASILGRRNLVGAAPTGSGKTIAFLLPILNHLLLEQDIGGTVDSESQVRNRSSSVQALIMTPTRELATQIHSECDKLLPGQCVTLVGGIALVKQKRLLDTKKPPIVIATPGRLWAMLSSGDHTHLRDLSSIRFLVLDEADRLTQEHSFPQLIEILDAVHTANPRETEDDEETNAINDESYLDDEDGDRLLGLPGVRGEAQLTMLTDSILDGIEAQKGSTIPQSREVADGEFPDEDSDEDDGESSVESSASVHKEKVHRQTFIFSATLTLPFTSTKNKGTTKAGKRSKKLGLDGGIAEILEKTRAMGETKVVDLSSTSSNEASLRGNAIPGVRLPSGLSLEQIKCTQRHKDSHLYAYLMTTEQGASGPCLVFCNSIAAVRRVGATLQTLGLPVRILHAHMEQRARFKAVESLKTSDCRTVVVSTDVAARGLDIPSVSTVVHYDVARAVDTFVHRSGRTARGMGEGAVGSSISLVAPAEDKAHRKIVESLGVTFIKVLLDGRLLAASQERTNLASKIISADEMQQKANSHNRWFLEKAKEAELDLDEGLLEDDNNRSEQERQQLLEAKRARVRLSQLLAEPMKKQKFGKFLSTNSEAISKGLGQMSTKSST
ncbi:DEAD/DEAH box helicase domain protein [Nitzschia inconspicua]|uniref:DEAD/DEAH box helicase domain protein n=1 Tax=Nitzschia inconspicua TaxID=303405 RepID=A0A9K3LBQ6_9STRA|nr:DEAD/DEAH box helicase domain protein [Nitzschia inconspicua]